MYIIYVLYTHAQLQWYSEPASVKEYISRKKYGETLTAVCPSWVRESGKLSPLSNEKLSQT